jgi:hypothetical protein
MASITNALNTITQGTVNSFDPTTSAMNTLQGTLTGLGGGLGSVLLSIPGIGQPTVNALNSLRKRAQDTLANARSMSPDKIREENDKINREYEKLVEEARTKGEAAPVRETRIQQARTTISSFFKDVFSNTLYISIFIFVVILALFGSSIAANSIGPGMPFYYYIYYMLYGFLLFPVSILLGIWKYYVKGKRPMFYALWAPMFQGKYTGIFQYALVNTDIINYTSQSTAIEMPTNSVSNTN